MLSKIFLPLQGNLHDRYGHIVALSAKYLCLKMDFHAKVTVYFLCICLIALNTNHFTPPPRPQHKVIPGNLEASDETLEREAGTDNAKLYVFNLNPQTYS